MREGRGGGERRGREGDAESTTYSQNFLVKFAFNLFVSFSTAKKSFLLQR